MLKRFGIESGEINFTSDKSNMNSLFPDTIAECSSFNSQWLTTNGVTFSGNRILYLFIIHDGTGIYHMSIFKDV